MIVPGVPVRPGQESEVVANEVIVKIAPGASQAEIEAARAEIGATLLETTRALGLERWSIPDGSLERVLPQGQEHAAIEYIQPNRVYSIAQTLPDDPELDRLWGLDNRGQTGGSADADIDAPEAWDLETGSDVVVGVIDTGIDYTHPDLADNIWVNPGEVADNGVDDDGNGFVDDYHGYDFVNEDGDPLDDHFHGTHVAGTIAAQGDNGRGVVGVAWDAQLMGVKVLDSGGFGTDFDIIQGIEYSALTGADISNNSYRGYDFSQGIYDAVALAGGAGQLFVAAAGNEANDNDSLPAYPASFDLANIVAVAATNANDALAEFSNYGSTTVDLGAPGEDIYSTVPGSGYDFLSGTSMATPHVAGVAALLLSQEPGLSLAEIKALLLETTDPLADLAGRTVAGGRLNAASALTANTPPVEVLGTEGPDTLTGTRGRDIIRGLGDDDVIQGLESTDRLFGDDGGDLIAAGAGDDAVQGGAGGDNLLGEDGDDTVLGEGGNDAILGGAGDDALDGGGGRDRILGEGNDDVIVGGTERDLLDGGDGDDQVGGGAGDDTVQGGAGGDSLTGDMGADAVIGGSGDDILDGGDGADRLIGVNPAGAEAAGRGEIDVLAGGAQGDRFVLGEDRGAYYEDGDPLSPGEDDHAVISDLDPTTDRVELAGALQSYVLDFFRTEAGALNADLIYDAGDAARGDRIAVLEEVSPGLAITDPAFVFLDGSATTSVAAAVTSPATGAPSEGPAVQQASIPLPTELFDGGGFRWDVEGNGSIIDGTSDAYDGGLFHDGFPSLETAETEEGGREIVLGPASIGGVEVVRKVYIPTDQPWARYLEIVTNNGASAVDYPLRVQSNLGSDSETIVVDTSSGDTAFDADDRWVVTDDLDAGGDPTMLHVIAGLDALAPASASLSADDLGFRYDLALAPGETQVVLHFAAQSSDQATALALGPLLVEPDADALAGLGEEELARIVNFTVEEPVPVIGTEGDDLLTGTDRADIIEGRGGDDLIQGLGGSDRLFGESGDDVVAGGFGGDTLSGGVGDDALSGDAGDDTITGEAGLDDLIGGVGDDALDGGSGNDRLLGEEGDDLIEAGAGSDTADGGAGADAIAGGPGDDRVIGGSGDDRLLGEEGVDTLGGGAGNDTLEGGAADDRLVGASIALGTLGLGETDTLTGGSGRDAFVLGDGTNVFYDDQDPTSSGQGDFALITDLRGAGDRIELTGAPDLYRLDFFSPSEGMFNAALSYDTDQARGDLIAVLQDVSVDLRLSDPFFFFA